MMRKFFRNLFHSAAHPVSAPKTQSQKEPRFKLGDDFFMEFDEVSNGYGGYRKVNLHLFKISDSSFRRCILDKNGKIQNFPGIVYGRWKEDLEFPVDEKVRFAFWIGKYVDGKADVSWTLQPDGRYFEDEDGFGAEKCEEICLYSCLDEDGKFTEPFHYNDI